MGQKRRPVLNQFLEFGMIAALLAVVLVLLNWVPSLIQPHQLKRYGSVDAARKELSLLKVYLPTYIPEHLDLSWPPSEVYAQDAPFRACIMNFTYKESREIGLVIQQTDARATFTLDPVIKVKEKKKENTVYIKDRKAVLIAAVCEKDVPCMMISWEEGGTAISLTGKKISTQDIVRVAGSMLP